MIKLTEFYAEKQGRPDSKIALDMESRKPSIPYGYLSGVMLTASYSTTSQTDNYTAAGYAVILVNTSSRGVTITLPAASANAGKYYYIKKTDSSGGEVTIKGNASDETIDGEADIDLSLQYQYIMVLCDGTVWHILGGEYVKLEDTLDRLLNEEIALLRQLLTEAIQVKLHLASGSDEPVTEESLGDE